MRFHQQVPPSALSSAPRIQNTLLRRLMTTVFAIGCILGLSVSVYSALSNRILVQERDQIIPPAGMTWTSPGLEAQILVNTPTLTINVEAFNKLREKAIANDSRKLVSLAIALKMELNHDSDTKLSSDAVKKAKEIEKLARDVKQRMCFNPSTGPI